jgi:hypothetical protein
MDRKAAKEFLREVGDTLYREWDPIGVLRMGGPTDQYESYAGPIASMLIKRDSDETLVKFLEWAEIEQMGLSGPFDPRSVQRVIVALRQLRLPNSN